MLYDSFFYNTVPQIDRNEAIKSKAWPMAMDLAKQVNPHLKVIRYFEPEPLLPDRLNKNIILGDGETGWPVMEVSYSKNDLQYAIRNWNRQLRKRGQNKYTLAGKTAGYVKRALEKAVDGGVVRMHSYVPGYINSELILTVKFLVQHVSNVLRAKAKLTGYGDDSIKENLTNETCEWLVRYALGEATHLEIPTHDLSAVSSAWKTCKDRFNAKQVINKTLREIVVPEKWAVGFSYVDGYQMGYFIGSVRFNTDNTVQSNDLKLYPTVQSYVETNPELGRQLMAAYTFMRRFWEKPEFNNLEFCDPAYRFVPKGDNVWSETGACSYYREYNSPSSPQWLIMDKLPCT